MISDPFTKGIIAEVNLVPVGWMKLFENTIEKKIFVSSFMFYQIFKVLELVKNYYMKLIQSQKKNVLIKFGLE